jgi:hypothetical protein
MLFNDKLKLIPELVEQQSYILKRFYAKHFLEMDLESFSLEGYDKKYRYFNHSHNMGFPCRRFTERTIELALADEWLNNNPDAWEIGAVSPYYWPKRVLNVIDPTDTHPQVNFHGSLFDFDLSGKDLLLISTIEHIGQSQYGLEEKVDAVQALEKISAEANNYLITFPVGWNNLLDDFVFSGGAHDLCNVCFLVRNKYELWEPAPSKHARLPYGGKKNWANSVAILERGNKL